jgi:hypothetical protein
MPEGRDMSTACVVISQRPHKIELPLCTKASSSARDESCAGWADEGHSSNTFLHSSEDHVFPAAVTRDPQQPESEYVVGLHGVPVQGQGSGGIGIAFRPVKGGAQVHCCSRFPSACASFAPVS